MSQNTKHNEDLRVRRTRKLLMQALVELTVERGFSSITVQDIANRAMVHRATFYRYYRDKYDLLDQYMIDVYQLTGEQTTDASGKSLVGMSKMLELVRTHADFYRAMLGTKGDLAFMQRIQQYIEMRLRSLMSSNDVAQSVNGLPLDLCVNYVSYAGIGLLVWWLQAGQVYSPDQVVAWQAQLNRGIFELL